MISVNVLVEGATDEAVAKRLLSHAGLVIADVYGRGGKEDLLKRLIKYNQSARFIPWFVIVDLDNDAACAPQAITQWLPNAEVGLRFRVAVRTIEAWLLADVENLSRFLGVSPAKFPHNPDLDPHPKMTLVRIARTSRKKNSRESIVPTQGSNMSVALGYTARLIDFTENYRQPDEAAKRSDSLRRCINALSTLKNWSTENNS